MTGYKSFNIETVMMVFAKTDGFCWYCGKAITIESRYEKTNKNTFCIDHLIPKTKGGNDEIKNLVPACCSCNNKKKDMTLEDFKKIMTNSYNGVPSFSKEQLAYLSQNGILLPTYPPYVFYFEIEAL